MKIVITEIEDTEQIRIERPDNNVDCVGREYPLVISSFATNREKIMLLLQAFDLSKDLVGKILITE